MKVLKREKIKPIYVYPGDTLQMEYIPEDGEKQILLTHNITEEIVYDTAIIIELENGEFGLTHGLGGIFGKQE